MKARLLGVALGLTMISSVAATPVARSGPVGLYGVIERVVFEPNEANAERAQVWGAFAYTDSRTQAVSEPRRGYLYFKIADASKAPAIRAEWADLKKVAGTSQGVAFGSWVYVGGFPSNPGDQAARVLVQGGAVEMRIHPAAEAPKDPAPYQTNVGVIKLNEDGGNGAIVKRLRDLINTKVAK